MIQERNSLLITNTSPRISTNRERLRKLK